VSDFRDLSRLPDDARYWEGLEARILADLRGRPDAVPAAPRWWAPLAARAWALGGVAAAAALAALLLAPGRTEAGPAAAWPLRPPAADPAFEALVASPAPPSVASFLLPASRSPR
jgi:hypothetical protein